MIFGLPPDVLFGLIVPGLIALLFGILAYTPFRRSKTPSRRQQILDGTALQKTIPVRSNPFAVYLLPLAVCLGYVLAIWGLRGRDVPPFPPVAAEGWLFYIAVLSILLAPLWKKLQTPGLLFLVSLLWGVGIAAANVAPLVTNDAMTLVDGVRTGAWSAAGIAAFLMFLWRAESSSGNLVTLVFALMLAAALALILLFSNTAFLLLIVATCAASLGVLLVLWWLRRDLSLGQTLSVVGVILSATLLQGYLYAEMPFESAVLFLAAAGLPALPLDEITKKAYIVRLAGTGLFLLLAVALAAGKYFEVV